jgi:rhomboid protease GluP
MPSCLKCGAPLAVNEEGVAPVLCDRCAGVATGRAQRNMGLGVLGRYPITTALVAINLTVFVGMVVTGGKLIDFTGQTTVAWGGNYGPYTLNGEWWRLVTAGFVHGGLLHIAFNMWCLLSLGQLSERLFGKFQTLIIYLLTGVGGALLSIAHSKGQILEVGASGAIFGIAGALLAGVKFGDLNISAGEKRAVISSMIFFVTVNFVLGAGLLGSNIDNFCHLGGFVTGVLLGVPLGGFAQRHKLLQWVTLAVTAIMLSLGYKELVQTYGVPESLRQAQAAVDHQDYPRAIDLLEQYTRSNQGDSHIWSVLGALYIQNNQRDKAVAAFQQALKINPGSEEAKRGLQLLGAAPPEKD